MLGAYGALSTLDYSINIIRVIFKCFLIRLKKNLPFSWPINQLRLVFPRFAQVAYIYVAL